MELLYLILGFVAVFAAVTLGVNSQRFAINEAGIMVAGFAIAAGLCMVAAAIAGRRKS